MFTCGGRECSGGDRSPGRASPMADKTLHFGLGDSKESIHLIIIRSYTILSCGFSKSVFYSLIKKKKSISLMITKKKGKLIQLCLIPHHSHGKCHRGSHEHFFLRDLQGLPSLKWKPLSCKQNLVLISPISPKCIAAANLWLSHSESDISFTSN